MKNIYDMSLEDLRHEQNEVYSRISKLDRNSSDYAAESLNLNSRYRIIDNAIREHSPLIRERRERVGRDEASCLGYPPVHFRNGEFIGDDNSWKRRLRENEIDSGVCGWARYGAGIPAESHELTALSSLGYSPAASEIHLKLKPHPLLAGKRLWAERTPFNFQQWGDPLSGGLTVPQGFVDSLEVALSEFASVMNTSTVLRTQTGQPLALPMTDDTANAGTILNEGQQASEQDVEFSALNLSHYVYSSKVVKISNQLLRDSGLDLGSELGRLLGERIGRAVNSDFTLGAATGPRGIVPSATVGVTAGSSTAIAADEVIDLIHSVDPAYRINGRTGFMMHDSVIAELSKLKDGDGNYLFSFDAVDGRPRLRGWPVWTNNNMSSSVTSGEKVVLFGDLTKYVVRQVGDLRIMRLVERWADYNQTGFLAFMSFDGALRDAGTNPVKVLQMA